MNNQRNYVLSPYTLLVRDKPSLFNSTKHYRRSEEALQLEQYINDLYHHFLYILTKEMQSAEISDENRLKNIFEELLKQKKKLQTIE